jgi:ribA/ribD-fused uncharacterized protein
MPGRFEESTYNRREAAVFRKTDEPPYGSLSNMAAGFLLEVNGVLIRTAEALYQACKYPHSAAAQREILEQKSPMAAKMISKKHENETRPRPDWHAVRADVMRWCLRVKLARNWCTFGSLLRSTGVLPIVEDSPRDPFWGAKAIDDSTLRGHNVLGKLLMDIREEYRECPESYEEVQPLEIPDFLLYGAPIQPVRRIAKKMETGPESGQQLELDLPV